MVQSRRRRIVKRSLWGLASAVFLLASYLNLYLAACWADSRCVPCWHGPCWNGLAVFDPLYEYGYSELPGARDFQAFATWILNGRTGTLAEEYEFCDRMRPLVAKAKKQK